ncbi:hypothetical protein LMG31506_03016 [Cupriavidus yeoncheonensis]|uniref:Holin n=1 Tax=Cupriavidus yeoncheonensis TaxID=1462994 RepID=A0A916NE29_9BURK|nr:hypothetical protein [Cupriavidus yeoncheonensis]CAG2144484.1 hypothetical protein LMG31506_03016 [Cupriavidus yeoncheonensis]
MDNSEHTGWLIAKIASAWAAVGIASWNDAAGFAAFMYTAWLIGQKAWREHVRPFLQRHGLVSSTSDE